MEPFDTALNGEGSAYSTRRVSSILKAPRRSYIVPDSEQQENRVECVKTVEKRISRRVSFAATNNVLLFSDDAKSDTSAAGKQRTRASLTEDLGQQAAKENFRPASLHTSEPWDKVNFDTRDYIGDETVMFGSDDAFMDMTQSHSVHLATDAELLPGISVDNSELASREKTQIFSADDGSMDMTLSHTSRMASMPECLTSLESHVKNKNPSSSVSCLDPDFENFLSSLFKPNRSSAKAVDARATTAAGTLSEETNSSLAQLKVPKCHVDKENRPLALLEVKSIRKRSRTPENRTMDVTKAGDEGMDMTLSHTVTLSSGLPAPLAQSHTQGKKAHISSQEEKKMEGLSMSSMQCTGFSSKPAAASLSTTALPDSCLLGSRSDPARTKIPSVSFLSKGEGQAFHTSSSSGGRDSREDDEAMDMTEAPTRFITGWNDEQVFLTSQKQEEQDIPEKASSTTNSAVMDVLLKPALKVKTHEHKFDAEDDCTDMVVFSGADACMDVTESCTGSIATDFAAAHNVMAQSCDIKKVRQTLGQQHSLALRLSCYQGAETMTAPLKSNVDQVRLHADEKTRRFTADDACMDMTQCQTVNIAKAPNSEAPSNSDFTDIRDETVTFSANVADMEVTQCLTGNIATDHILDAKSTCVDRTVTISADMDMTQCNMDNSASHWATTSVGQKRDSFSFFSKSSETGSDCPLGNHPSTGRALNPRFKSLSKRSSTWANPVIVKAAPATLASVHSENTQVEDYLAAKGELSSLVPAVPQSLENVTMENLPEDQVQSNLTPAPNGSDEPLFMFSAQVSPSHSDNATEMEKAAPEQRGSPDLVVHSRESKRMSFADLQSKVRRLSQMVHAAPGHTAPLPQLEIYLDSSPKDESQPLNEQELHMASGECGGDAQADNTTEEDQNVAASATPFKVKCAELLSRLSVGDFKPRLPQRGRSNDAVMATPIGSHARTVTPCVASELPGLDCNVSDLYNEELGSCEDMSEMLETDSPPPKASETASVFLSAGGLLPEGNTSDTNVKKRPLTPDEDREQQKRTSMEMAANIDVSHQGALDSNMAPAACSMSHTIDENISQTASGRYESTFESTLKRSLFESHFEEYFDDMQTKLHNGTITVKEFFTMFNIDFVIHNPRQSSLPDGLSDGECTPMALLKAWYIYRPKQLVYEDDIRSLAEKVDGLRGRMQDLDRPLKMVNRSLWEEMCSLSEEELKFFGAKLKEQNNAFRKMSKAQSHEMKEVLYSNIVQANEEAQQRLREKIDEADEMIKTLDDCIDMIETELKAVEETGSEDLPSLKSCQEEMERVTVALAACERQTSELETQNEQNIKKLDKLKTETKDLQSHVSTMHLLTEWKVGERSDNTVAFTFLYGTFHLHVLYQNENVSDKPSEREIRAITFTHEVDEERTKDCGLLVHRLLYQYVVGAGAWVDKYKTSRHVPMLLQDVSLVVSACRLLGEELRLLSTWGYMTFDILSISCVDTRVTFVFSSLKSLSKFEITFSTCLTGNGYGLHVQSFNNKYGSTTIQKIDEIVASFSPCKNLLTKIVKKIHSSLLC